MRIAEITFSGWLAAFCLTLLVEIPAVLLLARRLEPRPYRRAALALLGNALSHSAVWFVFPALFVSFAANLLSFGLGLGLWALEALG